GVKLRTCLRLVLAQVQADFYQQDGLVMVVPATRMAPPFLFQRPVEAAFSRQPLSEALLELSDLTGVSVVVDARVAEKAKVAVTAAFAAVALETAVRVLADMADLKSVAIDKVLYVTTRENAKMLQAEQEQRQRAVPKPEPKEESK